MSAKHNLRKVPMILTLALALAPALASLFLDQRPAWAGGSTKEKTSSAPGGGGGGEATSTGGIAFEPGVDSVIDRRELGERRWQISLGVEYHHLLESDYAPGLPVGGAPDTGNALNRNAIVYDASAIWDITPADRLWAEWGFVQRFIRNSGEGICPGSGPDDGIVAYRRTVRLRRGFVLRVQPRVDIGLSCESVRYQSLIAAPRLGASLEKEFGPLFVSFETHGYYYWEKYTSYTAPGGDDLGGGAPTPLASWHGVLRVSSVMPFYRRLSVGALATAAVTWYHQVGGATPGGQGTVTDPLVGDQPYQNSYGGEIYVRLVLPPVNHVYGDLLIAYADGDPTVTGYQSLLHDNGRASFNLFYRNVSEVYTALTFHY